MIAILDYGLGNLRSVHKALERVGAEAAIETDPARLGSYDRIILPGVGNFADGMRRLIDGGWDAAVREFAATGRPTMGVCMGMQFLLDSSEEDMADAKPTPGLGLIPGKVLAFCPESLDHAGTRIKVPHMGWNTVELAEDRRDAGGLSEAIADQSFYFVHGYYCQPDRDQDVLGWTDYGVRFASVLQTGNLFATQFHPEKSQAAGLQLLERFATLKA